MNNFTTVMQFFSWNFFYDIKVQVFGSLGALVLLHSTTHPPPLPTTRNTPSPTTSRSVLT